MLMHVVMKNILVMVACGWDANWHDANSSIVVSGELYFDIPLGPIMPP
jgi:hypothetical protein